MSIRTHATIVEDQFGPQAAAYLASAVHASGEELLALRQIIGNRPDAVALDLGCGGGHAAFVLSPCVRQVVAVDLSEAMVAVTRAEAQRRGLANLVAQRALVERLPYPDAMFDIVVSRYSAHHWNDIAAGLREARRVLQPGGVAVFMDVMAPGRPLLDTWLQSLELLRDPSHVRNYSLAEWHGLLAAAGFGAAAARCFRVVLAFQPWIERMNTPSAQVTAIRALQAVAPADVSRHFSIQDDGTFTVDAMLVQATGGAQ